MTKAGWKVGYSSPIPGSTATAARADGELIVQELKARLEERYLRYYDESVPFMLFTRRSPDSSLPAPGLMGLLPKEAKRTSTECDRAWEFINTAHNRWNMNERGKRGNLWRPIQRLIVKAQNVWEMQQLDPGFHLAGRMATPDTTPVQAGSSELQQETPDPYGIPDMQVRMGIWIGCSRSRDRSVRWNGNGPSWG
ncbi:bikaverin cluster transcription factor bik5 [Ditylenchus destructor]|nr:bikaverin cluster transcription factor bik5 [Ditylenchus destructor]